MADDRAPPSFHVGLYYGLGLGGRIVRLHKERICFFVAIVQLHKQRSEERRRSFGSRWAKTRVTRAGATFCRLPNCYEQVAK